MGMYDTITCELPCQTKGCKGKCIDIQTKAFGCDLRYFDNILPISEQGFYGKRDRFSRTVIKGIGDCKRCGVFQDWFIYTNNEGYIMRFLPDFR